jgi:hypothetical protein
MVGGHQQLDVIPANAFVPSKMPAQALVVFHEPILTVKDCPKFDVLDTFVS